jgi:hypothetical protein
MAQAVARLPSKRKALNSNTSTAKNLPGTGLGHPLYALRSSHPSTFFFLGKPWPQMRLESLNLPAKGIVGEGLCSQVPATT